MSDEVTLHGKTYVSSKKAAQETGYARDYIGQLSRGGYIDAERVGGLWYVSLDSLRGYEKNADTAKMISAATSTSKESESLLTFEGRDFVSASRASKLTGYNQDYVGQLARGGKIPSRQIGNRWYVDQEALVRHKQEKDDLLAAVQSEAMGLKPSVTHQAQSATESNTPIHSYTYVREERDLIPMTIKPDVALQDTAPARNEHTVVPHAHSASLRVNQEVRASNVPIQIHEKVQKGPMRATASRKLLIGGGVGVLTIVLLLTVGLTTLSSDPTIAQIRESVQGSAMMASSGEIFGTIGDSIENIVSPELVYERSD